jgi:hypothetical protein
VTAAGYSGTPLAKKLGVKAGDTVAILNEPTGFREWLAPLPEDVRIRKSIGRSRDVVVIFAKRRARLQPRVEQAAGAVFPDGCIWIGWPKRSSKVATDLTEDVVRAISLPLGLVDTKVCAISKVWSGLRVVWRKELRTQTETRPQRRSPAVGPAREEPIS